jgi:hypothetical protein
MKRGALVLAVLFMSFVLALPGQAGDSKKGGKMTFMIETTHTPEECLRDLDMVVAETPKLLDKVEWGCGSGVHKGWLTVSVDNEAAARNMLPAGMRSRSNVVALNKFTVEQIRSYHTKK